jgi:hypothetical protein
MPKADLPHSVLWGASIALLLVVGSIVYTPETLPAVDVCYFHRLTGLPCAGCGLTRSVCSIAHGEFARAWAFNPFGYFAYMIAVALLLRPAIFRRMPGLEKALFQWTAHRLVPIGATAVLVIFGLWRMLRIAVWAH